MLKKFVKMSRLINKKSAYVINEWSQSMDNVPLLVSLFTDCTPDNTKEMVVIMQDYGEVVCVLGSAANHHNMKVFMQADASLAIEPLYPQVTGLKSLFYFYLLLTEHLQNFHISELVVNRTPLSTGNWEVKSLFYVVVL